MLKPAKSRAEEQFAATQKKAAQAQEEKEKLQKERAEHMAGLKALRMVKEAAEKKADAEAAAEKAKAKAKTKPKAKPKVRKAKTSV